MNTAIDKTDVGLDGQILQGVRYQHFAPPRQRAQPGTDVHGDPGDIIASAFDLTGVDPGDFAGLAASGSTTERP